MNSQHLAIRTRLKEMAPRRAMAYVRSFHLQPEEELFILDHDVLGKSIQQIATENSVSPETVKRRRKTGFLKIIDAL